MPMQVFTVGQVLAAADVNEYLVNTRYAVKAADTSRISTTTLASDPDLTVAVDANKTYLVDLFMQFTSPTAAGLKFAFAAVPAGATLNGYGIQTTGTTVNGIAYDSANLATAVQSLTSTTGFEFSWGVRGMIITSSTPGSLTVQWAQNTSTATNTTVRQGSSLLLRRVS